ncbi:MAG TPA: peptidoglycan-binding domain-containing protein [Candidatus Limiplasma sp.]|nr:peptidoglycan-binding domain-containing protein [Candidatus Limiplasma sp.]HPS81546.1 peptidoglycan-binding domain-containing protein [Candidatus Limiplasma sp.]
MDLLKTILLYLTMVFVSSVQSAPDPSLMPATETVAPTATIVIAATVTAEPTATPTPVPTPNITPNDTYKTIRVGDKGEDVKLLQNRLAELGYFTGEVDGVFGNQTRRAVERFQYYQGLSADGIAGKRTLTVLYESKEVVYAPTETTLAPTATQTNGPTAAITAAPATPTPAPTFVPAPTASAETVSALLDLTPTPDSSDGIIIAEPDATDSAAPEATVAVDQTPQTLTAQDFILASGTAPLTAAAAASGDSAAAEPAVLHPVQAGDTVYVPVLDILQAAGIVTVPGAGNTDTQEVAFSVNTDVYQIAYTLDNLGTVTDLKIIKNQTPQVLSLRQGLVMDGLFYLPMNVTTEVFGLTYTLDETQTHYTVALPTLPEG